MSCVRMMPEVKINMGRSVSAFAILNRDVDGDLLLECKFFGYIAGATRVLLRCA